MIEIDLTKFAHELFDATEDSIYDVLGRLKELQNIDQSFTYIFIKAYYLYYTKVYLKQQNSDLDFNSIYSNYRNYLSIYYKSNNSLISQELLDDLLGTFDTSFQLIESFEFENINDGYEYRHFTIDAFEILRKILEKKSKSDIRTDIFESEITTFVNESEKLKIFINGKIIK